VASEAYHISQSFLQNNFAQRLVLLHFSYDIILNMETLGEQEKKQPQKPLGEIERIKLRILVADDNPLVRDMLVLLLQSMGHIVDVIDDGQKLLAKLNSEYSCDLVITDFEMPNIDGLEAFKIIRETEKLRKLPVFIVTGNSVRLEKEMEKRGVIAPYLAKPYTTNALSAKIKELTQSETVLLAK